MDKSQLAETLLNLKSASMSLGPKPCDAELGALIHEHDMIFCGEKYSQINSLELRHYMDTKLGITVTSEELVAMVPEVCALLGMAIEPLFRLSGSGCVSATAVGYNITLY